MSFTETIFNKSIKDFKIDILIEYFTSEQEETDILEFKCGDVQIEDLYKEIAAFLNTEGGLIIVGSPREQRKSKGKIHKNICIGELTYTPFRSKDWLFQKIMSNITPPPTGIKIFEHIDDNGSIYMLDIPQSDTPPHQSNSDGRYYIRLECEAKPAPHGIIKALFNKRKNPILSTNIEILPINDNYDNITIDITNESNIPAEKVCFLINIFGVDKIENNKGIEKITANNISRHSYQYTSETILVKHINMGVEFKTKHYNSQYLIYVAYWSKDLDIENRVVIYNPKNEKIENEYNNKFDISEELKKIEYFK